MSFVSVYGRLLVVDNSFGIEFKLFTDLVCRLNVNLITFGCVYLLIYFGILLLKGCGFVGGVVDFNSRLYESIGKT